MSTEVYERLAEALDRLPNGFPRTPSGAEIRLLQKIYSPEEAALAAGLSGRMEPIDDIAQRLGMDVKEARHALVRMVRKGMAWYEKQDGERRFRLAPFAVGVYEFQLESMDHELAHLFEEYMADGGVAGIMGPEPALQRVVPAHGAVKTELVLPYDDVRAILLSAKTYRVSDCICRRQQDELGTRRCDFPLKVCLYFSWHERPPRPDDISQEEALAVLDLAEDVGLVHSVSNVAAIDSAFGGMGYICNCCGCCCGILRGITDYGIQSSVARANYYAVIDPDECVGCGICIDRCQVKAIHESDGVSVVDRERCIGCGLCVTGCPDGVAKLVRLPDAEMIHPPENFADWEQKRLANRGLA